MATDAERLVQLVRKTTDQPQYEQLMNYLGSRKAVPGVSFADIPQDGVFDVDPPAPPEGAITLNINRAGSDTLIHELTHAATRQLANQFKEGKSGAQFNDAFEKIMLGARRARESAPVVQSRAFNPVWNSQQAGYRDTPSELLSFGMGNSFVGSGTVIKDKIADAPPHLDPTLATQMMILLDLATRASKTKQGR